jgi:hypothetical protein
MRLFSFFVSRTVIPKSSQNEMQEEGISARKGFIQIRIVE